MNIVKLFCGKSKVKIRKFEVAFISICTKGGDL